MAIKDLRKLNESAIKLAEAKELLEADGFIVAKEVTFELDEAVSAIKEAGHQVIFEEEIEGVETKMKEAVIESIVEAGGVVTLSEGIEDAKEAFLESLKEDGTLVIAESEIEEVEEALKDRVISDLKEDGYTILDEEMMDKVDEELEAILAERMEEALGDVSDLAEGELPQALKNAIAKKKAKSGDKDDDKKDEGDDKDADDKDDEEDAEEVDVSQEDDPDFDGRETE